MVQNVENKPPAYTTSLSELWSSDMSTIYSAHEPQWVSNTALHAVQSCADRVSGLMIAVRLSHQSETKRYLVQSRDACMVRYGRKLVAES